MTNPLTGIAAVRLALAPGTPIDPFALAGQSGILFHGGGRVLVGMGAAGRIELPRGLDGRHDVDRVSELLASVRCEERYDTTTSGVIAFGSLPFDRSAPAALVVPAVTYGREADGTEWVTMVASPGRPAPIDTGRGEAGLAARGWLLAHTVPRTAASVGVAGASGSERFAGAPVPARVTPLSTDEEFRTAVDDALLTIATGQLAKVVLARQVDVRMSALIELAPLLRRWHRMEPSCTVFSMPGRAGRFVGASPELLVERKGTHVTSRPLAGTTDRSGVDGPGVDLPIGRPTGAPADPSSGSLPRELLRSAKDGSEHRLVVTAIRDALAPLCVSLDVPDHPDLVHLHNLIHLGTVVSGTLAKRRDAPLPTALQLVDALHPTPAVGGVPTNRAVEEIARLEPVARDRYAGPVGYVDARGDGRWMVGIRAMSVSGDTARLAAGVGIVEGSDPRTESAETQLKFTAVFDALAPGEPFSTAGDQRAGDQRAGDRGDGLRRHERAS